MCPIQQLVVVVLGPPKKALVTLFVESRDELSGCLGTNPLLVLFAAGIGTID